MAVGREDLIQNYASKSEDELHSLHGSGTLTELAYEVLEAEMTRRRLAVPSRPEPTAQAERLTASYNRMTLRAHWEGTAPLASAYWLVGTAGGLVVLGLMAVIEVVAPNLLLFADLLFLAFGIFACVSIWRCAKNTAWKGWGYMARAVVVLNAIILAILVVGAVRLGEY